MIEKLPTKGIKKLDCHADIKDKINELVGVVNDMIKEFHQQGIEIYDTHSTEQPMFNVKVCPFAPEEKILTECPMKSKAEKYRTALQQAYQALGKPRMSYNSKIERVELMGAVEMVSEIIKQALGEE